MIRVLGIGDNVCDIYLHTGTMYPGGQALNFSVYASKLGAMSDFMGVFGQDAVAEHIQATLDVLGIGRGHCRNWPGENGFARVALVDGDRVFKGSNCGGVLQRHPIVLEPADLDYAAEFDLIHTSNNSFLDGLLPQLHTLPGLLSYDFSIRWNEEDRVERVCPHIDAAFLSCSGLNDEETKHLCRRVCERGCAMAVATRGDLGVTAYDGLRFYHQAPDYVEPVDTMGAGDSFAAALMMTIAEKLKELPDDSWQTPEARARLIPQGLKRAVAFSREICLINGAFNYGIPVPEHLRPRIYAEELS